MTQGTRKPHHLGATFCSKTSRSPALGAKTINTNNGSYSVNGNYCTLQDTYKPTDLGASYRSNTTSCMLSTPQTPNSCSDTENCCMTQGTQKRLDFGAPSSTTASRGQGHAANATNTHSGSDGDDSDVGGRDRGLAAGERLYQQGMESLQRQRELAKKLAQVDQATCPSDTFGQTFNPKP